MNLLATATFEWSTSTDVCSREAAAAKFWPLLSKLTYVMGCYGNLIKLIFEDVFESFYRMGCYLLDDLPLLVDPWS